MGYADSKISFRLPEPRSRLVWRGIRAGPPVCQHPLVKSSPAYCFRSALENAVSVASMVLTTESLVTDLPDKNPPAAPAGNPGGMGGMY